MRHGQASVSLTTSCSGPSLWLALCGPVSRASPQRAPLPVRCPAIRIRAGAVQPSRARAHRRTQIGTPQQCETGCRRASLWPAPSQRLFVANWRQARPEETPPTAHPSGAVNSVIGSTPAIRSPFERHSCVRTVGRTGRTNGARLSVPFRATIRPTAKS